MYILKYNNDENRNNINACTHTHIYIHTHTHTQTHIYIYILCKYGSLLIYCFVWTKSFLAVSNPSQLWQVAHVSALFQPFLVMLVAASAKAALHNIVQSYTRMKSFEVETGTPKIPALFALAFVSNLFATLTPYVGPSDTKTFGDLRVCVRVSLISWFAVA